MFGWFGSHKGPIGLVAGTGEFPLLFAEALSQKQKPMVLFGLRGITDPRIERYAQQSFYIEFGELGTFVQHVKKSGVSRIVLAGGVPKREMYNPGSKFDGDAKSFLSGNRLKGDDKLLRAFELFVKARCGVSVCDSRAYLKELLSPKGVLTRKAPTRQQWDDLKLGIKVARSIGRMDIGQTVVVKQGVVLAVEAIEGTDEAIRRGGELGRGQAVVVKFSKPGQDLRFDLPCVGVGTVETAVKASVAVLGIEAKKTLMLNRKKMIDAADGAGLSIVGL